jgi:hypothetical protein
VKNDRPELTQGQNPPAQDIGGVAVWSTLREGVHGKIQEFENFESGVKICYCKFRNNYLI